MENKTNPAFFTSFPEDFDVAILPLLFSWPLNYSPHPVALKAAGLLQSHLEKQTEWSHNFGLTDGQEGEIIGKMFGVLVVQTQAKQIGYLSSYSGKLAGGYHQSGFVPPVFDGLTEGSFLNLGMTDLTDINLEIKNLEEEDAVFNLVKISLLKKKRKENSVALQEKIFDHYQFLNQEGEEKNLHQIFKEALNTKPPSGAGECAAPRLLQYAFQHKMKPIAMAEFWWGLSPKSDYWKHGQFYPACKEKCGPILAHMLKGMELE